MPVESFKTRQRIDEERFRDDNITRIQQVIGSNFKIERDLFTDYQVHHWFGDLEIVSRVNQKIEQSETPVVILEIGCGLGNLLADLAESAEDYRRFLFEEQNLSRPPIIPIGINLKRLPVRGNINQLVADAHQLPLNSESVDFVVSVMTWPYLVDKLRALEGVYRVLKPGGEAFIHNYFDSTRPNLKTIARGKLSRKSLIRNHVVHLVKNPKRPQLNFHYVYAGFEPAFVGVVSIYKKISIFKR